MSNLRNYIAECVRLLYWIYFKPYTLKQWLKDIHPDLKPDDHPYLKLKKFPKNKRLYRYAGQVFWLTVITPQLIVLLVGLIYTAVTQESFAWLESEMFLAGWVIGQMIGRFCYDFFGAKFNFTILNIFTLFVVVQFLKSVVYSVVLSIESIVALGIAFGVLLSVPSSVLLSIASSVALIVVFGVLLSALLGALLGVVYIVVFFVLLGILLSVVHSVDPVVVYSVAFFVVFGVLSNITYSVVCGVAFFAGVLRVYFWLPELFWMGLLFLLTRQGKFASKLHYLPPYFDQLIYLPLPFMDTMLVEAYRENPNATRETIAYLTNLTNQQKVAATAIVTIALDTLERCKNLRDIITINQELNWIPNPFPPELTTVLPQFIDISRSVESANMATSVYRKTELLKNPINSLSQIQNSYAFLKNPRIATTSSNIAQKWLSILETARRNLQEQSRDAEEIPQVYIAGPALNPETAQNRFKGRQDLFREIENIALMSPPPTLLLYGGRRTGKTSTLQYLPQKVGGDLIPLQVDIQGIADAMTLPGVAKSLVQQIIDSARISRNLTLPYPNSEDLKTEPFLTLKNWFTTIERTAPGKRFLLCLDEFERLQEVITTTNSRAPLNFLRHVIQHRSAWTLLFSGSHTLDEMESYWSDYLISTRYVRLTYLEQPEAEELIINPVPNFPNIYLPETVERIIYWTSCQPYLVQLLCSELVDSLNQKHPQNALKIKATSQDIDNIIPKALVRGSPYFDEFWKNTLNPQERECIINLIEKNNPTSEERQIWRKLIDKEILESNGEDQVSFKVPLIERSIIERI